MRKVIALTVMLLGAACGAQSPTAPETRQVPVTNQQLVATENNRHLNVAVRLENGEAAFLCAWNFGTYTLPDGTVAKVRYMLSKTPCDAYGRGVWYPVPVR